MSSRRDYTWSGESSFRSRHSREEELEEIWDRQNWNGPPSDVRPNHQHRSSDHTEPADLRRFEPLPPEPAPSASDPIRNHYKPYPRLSELPDNIDTTSFEFGTLFGPSTTPIERGQTYPRRSPPRGDFFIRSRSDDCAYNNDNPRRRTAAYSNPPSESLDRLLRSPPDRRYNNTRTINHRSRNLGTRNDSYSRLSSVSSWGSETNPSNTLVPGLLATESPYDYPEQPQHGGVAEEERYYQERIRPSNRFDGPPRDITIVPKQEQQQQQPRSDDDPLANLYPKDTQRNRINDNDRKKDSILKDPPPPFFSAAPQNFIEISPGTRVPLRGAVETWQAVRADFYTPCRCFLCSGGDDAQGCGDGDAAPPIFCIQDAAYVLCPVCRSVSPLDGGTGGHGVGLGFTVETLAGLQADMAQPLPPARLASHRDDDDDDASP